MSVISFRRSIAGTLLFLLPLQTFAATRTWDAGGADNNWGTAANWSDDTVPTAADTALFDGTGQTDAMVNSAFDGTVGELRVTESFTGAVIVDRALTTGNIFLSGGTLQINGGRTLSARGHWVNDGAAFTAGTGTVILAGSGTSYVLKEESPFWGLTLNDGLIGYWKMDEGPGHGIIPDHGGIGKDGTIANGNINSDWVTTIPDAISFEDPFAYNFVSNTRIDIAGLDFEPQRFTISVWLNPHEDTCNIILDKGNGAAIRLALLGGDNFHTKIKFSDETIQFNTGSLQLNAWQHVVSSYDGSAIRLYVNGELAGQRTKENGTLLYTMSNRNLVIGNTVSPGYCPYDGLMDDFRIYSRALSHSEIQALAAGNQGTGSGKYTLASNLTVRGNLHINSGMLDVSSSDYSITASGSFINNASFVPRSGTLTLNGIATTLKTYGTELYNLTITSAKSAVLRTAAAVTNALTLNTSSLLTLNGHTLTATSTTISNNGEIVEGTGAILHTSTSFLVSPPAMQIGDTIHITVTDSDANLDGTAQDTVTSSVSSETVTLTETTAASGIFQGSIPTAIGATIAQNGTVEHPGTCGDLITVSYTDAQDATDTRSSTITVMGTSSYCDPAPSGGSGGGSTGGGDFSRTPAPSSTPSSASTSSSAEEPSGNSFSDIPASSWFASFVRTITDLGIVSGYADAEGNLTGTFGPADPVTIGQTIKIALLAAGHELPVPSGIPQNPTATDWSAPYIALAESLNLTLASENVTQNATRGEVIQALLEASAMDIEEVSHPFTDLPANHPHAKAIATAHALGIVTGDTDAEGNPLNTVRPDDTINRAEVAALVVRMVHNE